MSDQESSQALALRDEDAPAQTRTVTLFGSNEPDEVLNQATKVAKSLSKVIDDQKLFSNISGRKHVLAEGWTLLGSLLGVFPVLDDVKPLNKGTEVVGYKATVSAQTLSGATIGRASAYCLRSEPDWSHNPPTSRNGNQPKPREDFALASMAQTRATSKCLRAPLGFVMKLAGYDPTPRDEMPGADGGSTGTGNPSQKERAGNDRAAASSGPKVNWTQFWQAAKKAGEWFKAPQLDEVLELLGVGKPDVTKEQLQTVLNALKDGKSEVGTVAAFVMEQTEAPAATPMTDEAADTNVIDGTSTEVAEVVPEAGVTEGEEESSE